MRSKLTSKDIENVKMLNECRDDIDKKVNKYKEDISKEIFNLKEKDGFTKESMIESEDILYMFKNNFYSNDGWVVNLITGILFILFCSFTVLMPINNEKWISVALGALGVYQVYNSIESYIVRKKIKASLKEIGVEIIKI